MERHRAIKNFGDLPFRHLLAGLVSLLTTAVVWGCATQSVVQPQHAFSPTKHRTIWVEQCIDRSAFQGSRDIAKEATETLVSKVKANELFEYTKEASLVLTCEIEGFVEGSALQRWLLPGWGATEAKVAVVVWEKPGDKILLTLRSYSTVKSGGLYTIGADQYILGVAMDDIVGQLESWARGNEAVDPKN